MALELRESIKGQVRMALSSHQINLVLNPRGEHLLRTAGEKHSCEGFGRRWRVDPVVLKGEELADRFGMGVLAQSVRTPGITES